MRAGLVATMSQAITAQVYGVPTSFKNEKVTIQARAENVAGTAHAKK